MRYVYKRHKLYACYSFLDSFSYRNLQAELEISSISINMGKRCVAAGCSNTNAHSVSLFRWPRNPSLCAQWNKQVQRTRADWKDATDYSDLRSDHFTSDCFEKDSHIVAQFGIVTRKRLKPHAVPIDASDLVSYLVLQTSFITAKQFKARKGLEAYNQFVSGWVKDVRNRKVCGKHLHGHCSCKPFHYVVCILIYHDCMYYE